MTRKLTDRELSVAQISRETGLSRSAIFWRAVKYGDNSPLVGHAARLNSTPAKDHTGRVFPSLRKMAEHWGVPYAVFFNRFKQGWPLEAALTAPARRKRCFTDHKGNIFYSREDMLKYWGVPRWRYYQEAAADVPLREILETFGSKK